MTEPLRVVIYAREEHDGQDDGVNPGQVGACGEFAKGQGPTVDGRPESDEAASAYSGDRDAGLEASHAARQGARAAARSRGSAR